MHSHERLGRLSRELACLRPGALPLPWSVRRCLLQRPFHEANPLGMATAVQRSRGTNVLTRAAG
jgi:hypothetical protein